MIKYISIDFLGNICLILLILSIYDAYKTRKSKPQKKYILVKSSWVGEKCPYCENGVPYLLIDHVMSPHYYLDKNKEPRCDNCIDGREEIIFYRISEYNFDDPPSSYYYKLFTSRKNALQKCRELNRAALNRLGLSREELIIYT